MTLLYTNGCDSSTNVLSLVFGTVTVNTTGGVWGGGCYELPASTEFANYFQKRFKPAGLVDTTNPITRLSFWCKIAPGAQAASHTFLEVWDRTQATWGEIKFNTNNKLEFLLCNTNGADSVYYTADHAPINDGNWHNLQFAFRYATAAAPTSGYLECYLDGRLIAYFSSINNRTAGTFNRIDDFQFSNLRSTTISFDDIVVWDSYDTSDGFANAYVNPPKILTLRPVADTTQADSTPSTGTDRFAVIDEPVPNQRTDYIVLNNNQKDYYVFNTAWQNTVYSNANVDAIAVYMIASNGVSFSGNIRFAAATNGLYQNSATITIANNASTWNVFFYNYARDFGNSNVKWTVTTASNLQLGIENIGSA